MSAFLSSWLPNIVCGLAGCVISWAIGYRQARRIESRGDKHSLMLENLLLTAERQGHVELARDQNGRITGGNNVTVALTGLQMTATAGNVTASSSREAASE